MLIARRRKVWYALRNERNGDLYMKRLLTLVLCCAVLLCGCTGAKNALGYHAVVHYGDMEYVRPDLDDAARSAQAAIDAARGGKPADEIMQAVWDYYEAYNTFLTNYNLAYIHYHEDLNDFYWQREQSFCAEQGAQLDLYLEDIYYALARCDARQELEEKYFGAGWFDAYTGEEFYDEAVMALLEREQALVRDYYDLVGEAGELEEQWLDEHTLSAARLLADLIGVRQFIAKSAGYESYSAFAWDYYYYRDYTPAEAAAYLEEIRENLVPLYRRMNATDVWEPSTQRCTEDEVFDYVKAAAKAMGGTTQEAFRLLEQAGLYDIRTSQSKSGMSFEVYLPDYYEPFVFVSGTGTRYDCLSFAHEFGHFANDYASSGSSAGADVLEIFSQGMEYLSLCCGDLDREFIDMKLADSLSVYVEQAAYADFEQQMYSLTGMELTAGNLLELYEEVCRSYGFDSMEWDPRDMVTVPHFYGSPMYVISYVVSNDAAMQLYELELSEPGAGKQCFEENLATEEAGLLAFLRSAGLERPFGRTEEVRALMEARFGFGQ